MKKISLLLGIGLMLISCTGMQVRKQCETTDWYQHGYKRALEGQRLSGDPLIKDCEKYEGKIDYGLADQGNKAGMAEYCDPDGIYKVGKSGEFFRKDMCDVATAKMNLLKSRHKEGVLVFCEPENGYNKGTEGWSYNKICPQSHESAFLARWKKGRIVFLQAQISEKSLEVSDLDRQIRQLEIERGTKAIQLAAFGHSQQKVIRSVYNPNTGKYVKKTTYEEDPDKKRQREDMQRDLDSIESRMDNHRRRVSVAQQEIRQLKNELMRLR